MKRILSFAFASCQLTGITIPDGVTTIEKGAFAVNQLTSITIGANIDLLKPEYHINETFGGSFADTYNSAGRAAGTYILRDGVWSRQE
ncbi:MAG: leucine-rich repeat domain-containing protein [Chitinispirillales bacterium]|jgi:hypothetical protein|nr:leucine-rich repeat domain-containing protein [Chitinispirillales bacterium]